MGRLLIRLIINAIAIWAAAYVVDFFIEGGIQLTESLAGLLIVALIFGIVNTFIKPVLTLFSLPLIFFSLGLFTLVLNALLLWLTSALTGYLDVAGFGAALLGSLVISIVSTTLSVMLDEDKDKRDKKRAWR